MLFVISFSLLNLTVGSSSSASLMWLALVCLVVLMVLDDPTSLVTAVVVKSQSWRELWEYVLQLVLGQVGMSFGIFFVVYLISPHLEDVLHVDWILLEEPLLVIKDDILLSFWDPIDLLLTQHRNSFIA